MASSVVFGKSSAFGSNDAFDLNDSVADVVAKCSAWETELPPCTTETELEADLPEAHGDIQPPDAVITTVAKMPLSLDLLRIITASKVVRTVATVASGHAR